MKENSLITVLKKLSPKELRKFEEFLDSPYFNKSILVRDLFTVMKDQWPGFSGKNFTHEEIFRQVFKGREFNSVLLRNLYSDLLALAERFMSQQHFDKRDAFQKDMYLLKELSAKELIKHFVKSLQHAETSLNRSQGVDELYFRKWFDLQGEKINFYLTQNRPEAVADEFSKEGINLMCFSIISIVQIFHDLQVSRFTLNLKPQIDLINEFVESLNLEKLIGNLKKIDFHYYPVIEILYFQILTLKNNFEDKYYYRFKELFFEHSSLFSREWQHNLYIFLESCCVEKIHSGDTGKLNELFGVYKEIDKRGMFTPHPDDYIVIDRFRNIFLTAAELKDFKWAEIFLNKNKENIHPDYRKNMYNYCMAYIHFKKGELETAVKFISRVKYEYFVFRVDVKLLMLMIYYELNYLESIYSLLDSFKHFLSSNRLISAERKTINYNFLNVLKILTDHKNGIKYADISYTKHKLEMSTDTNHKSWLLEKIDALKKQSLRTNLNIL